MVVSSFPFVCPLSSASKYAVFINVCQARGVKLSGQNRGSFPGVALVQLDGDSLCLCVFCRVPASHVYVNVKVGGKLNRTAAAARSEDPVWYALASARRTYHRSVYHLYLIEFFHGAHTGMST